uniref:Uncharacterized protein n=1 Tax=Caenorhabditis japonica TaxID=281687 RepID=A0A8R1INR7_CAEJA
MIAVIHQTRDTSLQTLDSRNPFQRPHFPPAQLRQMELLAPNRKSFRASQE